MFALFGGAGTTFGKCSALVLGCPAYDQAVRDRLVAGEVVGLLYGDAEVEHSCDEGMAQVMGPDVAEAGSVAG